MGKYGSPASFKKTLVNALVLFTFVLANPMIHLPAMAFDSYGILSEIISEYNTELLQNKLARKQYGGQVGLLNTSPEIAQSLGLAVYVDEDYFEGKRLKKKAENLYKKLIVALKAHSSGYLRKRNASKIARLAAEYNKIKADSQKRFQKYLENLVNQEDERLDESNCISVLKRLLQKNLTTNGNRLRDGLAALHNQLAGLDRISRDPLNSGNVEFVNYVVNKFINKAPPHVMGEFYLDKIHSSSDKVREGWALWHLALDGKEAPFEKHLRRVFEKEGKDKNPIMDPVLFISLIKKESNFNARAVSYVGAVGLTQIMPSTGKQLGMNHIFAPPYFFKARKLLREERKLKQKAVTMVESITRPDMIQVALDAMANMKKSTDLAEKRAKLFLRYKREVLKAQEDDRLDPDKALIFGYRYLKNMLKRYKGDMSLALAAYNAGPNRVRQYRGIPPFEETVNFRNGVLRYYREYWAKIQARKESESAAVH